MNKRQEPMEVLEAVLQAYFDGDGFNGQAAASVIADDRAALRQQLAERDAVIIALTDALERLHLNFNLLLVGRPVRDVAETEAEVKHALARAIAGSVV